MKKGCFLILPFLVSCNQISVTKTRRDASSCNFDYTIRKSETITEYVSIKTQTLSKERTDKIIELDYTIRNTSSFKQDEVKDGSIRIKAYSFTLFSSSKEERRRIEIGESNSIRDSSNYKYYYSFARSKKVSELFDSIKPALDKIIESAETETIMC